MADWKKTNLKFRIISAVIGIPIFIAFLYLGHVYLLSLILIIIAIAFIEYLDFQKIKTPINLSAGFLSIIFMGYAFFQKDFLIALLPLVLFPALILASNLKHAFKVTFGIYYCSLLLFLSLLRSLGLQYVLAAVFLTWLFDIGSYIGGVKYGKHKIIPSISPGKSYEGLFSGLVLALLASLAFYFLPLIIRSLLAGVISVSSFIGDLIESKLKRLAEIKDSGTIIPGHGGILDRFDSLLISAPAGYYLIILFIKFNLL